MTRLDITKGLTAIPLKLMRSPFRRTESGWLLSTEMATWLSDLQRSRIDHCSSPTVVNRLLGWRLIYLSTLQDWRKVYETRTNPTQWKRALSWNCSGDKLAIVNISFEVISKEILVIPFWSFTTCNVVNNYFWLRFSWWKVSSNSLEQVEASILMEHSSLFNWKKNWVVYITWSKLIDNISQYHFPRINFISKVVE